MRKRRIANAHAFAMERATLKNINGSGMVAHVAALHRSAKRRKKHEEYISHLVHYYSRNNTIFCISFN